MKKSAYQDVFKQLVWGFFCGDIDSCLEVAKMVQARESNDLSLKGGCNFTAALVILCVIEMMAGYYKGKLDPSSRDVADFFVKYFSPYDPLFKNKDFIPIYYKIIIPNFFQLNTTTEILKILLSKEKALQQRQRAGNGQAPQTGRL